MTAQEKAVADKSISLSETQLSIMRVLWQAGEADTQTVCEGLKKSLAYTTVATLLKRLEKRGVIEARQIGRKHIFNPVVSEEEVMTSMVSTLIGTLFKGDSSALVSHLLKADDIKMDDLEKITKLIKESK